MDDWGVDYDLWGAFLRGLGKALESLSKQGALWLAESLVAIVS